MEAATTQSDDCGERGIRGDQIVEKTQVANEGDS
jgi:hypothetical protein